MPLFFGGLHFPSTCWAYTIFCERKPYDYFFSFTQIETGIVLDVDLRYALCIFSLF